MEESLDNLNEQLMQALSDQETKNKIRAFAKFEQGWHYGEGLSFEPSVLNQASELVDEAVRLGFYAMDAFPGFNGEVMVTIYFKDHDLDFIVCPDNTVTFKHQKDDEIIYHKEHLSLQDAKNEFRICADGEDHRRLTEKDVSSKIWRG